MPRLPPVEKLPLALRKEIRDEWDAKKSGFEQKLSEMLDTSWTIDISPNALYAYATSDYAKQSLGALIANYVTEAIYRLNDYKGSIGAEGIQELNTVVRAHILTMDVDEAGVLAYNGVVIADGKLVILFNENHLGTNVGDALMRERLIKAINEAPDAAAAPVLSFNARTSIRNDYESKIGNVQAAISTVLDNPQINLVPNFEGAYAILQVESKRSGSSLDASWEHNLGSFVFLYFDSVRGGLEGQGFGKDDMLRGGFKEAVGTNTIEFRIVEKLSKSPYCEVVLEDGKFYVQTVASRWGVNIDDAAANIVDML